jgi:glycosyltransferase involved in cell wall biosynthesis
MELTQRPCRAGISLVVPVRDEAATIRALLWSIERQTRPPDEVLIVDTGSNDDTVALARALTAGDPRFEIIQFGDATPGAARNVGVSRARHDLIALTDAGIELDASWLELLESQSSAADVVYGSYDPFPGSRFERHAALASVAPRAVRRAPGASTASCLVRRSTWDAVGGFLDLRTADDLIFMERVAASAARIGHAPGARLWWRIPPDLRSTFRRLRLYSRVNALAHRQRHWHYGVARWYLVAAPFVALAFNDPRWLLVPAGGFVARVLWHLSRQRDGRKVTWILNPIRVAFTAVVLVTVDAATFLGWAEAVRERLRRRSAARCAG